MDYVQNIFSKIYKSKEWNDPFSGPGSTYDTTKKYVEIVSSIIQKKGITSILDVGCGYWTFSSKINWNSSKYLGIDVVEETIIYNKQFESDYRKFCCCNILDIDIQPYDLVICKDVLQHLSNNTCILIIERMKTSKWMLLTNDITEVNHDCKDGEWRPINVRADPFNLIAEKQWLFDSVPYQKQSSLINNMPPS